MVISTTSSSPAGTLMVLGWYFMPSAVMLTVVVWPVGETFPTTAAGPSASSAGAFWSRR